MDHKYYWYEYRLRGSSIGAQPKGFVDTDPSYGRFGAVAYDRPLSHKELKEYELNTIPLKNQVVGRIDNDTWLKADGTWTDSLDEAYRFTDDEAMDKLDDLAEPTGYAVFSKIMP